MKLFLWLMKLVAVWFESRCKGLKWGALAVVGESAAGETLELVCNALYLRIEFSFSLNP